MVIRKITRSVSSSSSRRSSRPGSPASLSGHDENGGGGADIGNGEGTGAAVSEGELRRLRKIEEISMCLDGYEYRGCSDGGGGRSFEVDLWRLRELCLTRGGLVNAELRQRAWHKLLGINASAMDDADDGGSYARRDADQIDAMGIGEEEIGLIRRDVGRSVYFRFTKIDRDNEDEGRENLDGDCESDSAAPEQGATKAVNGEEGVGGYGAGKVEAGADDSLTASTVTLSSCASTGDDEPDVVQSVNQAADRLKATASSSKLAVEWGEGSCSSPESSPTATPEKGIAAESNGISSLSSPASVADIGSDDDSTDATLKKKKSLDWELQNLLMSLILSAIAPKRLDFYRSQSTDSKGSDSPREDRLHYYQGFHDIASVVLMQFGPDRPQLASAVLRKLARHNLRDNMREDFDLLAASLEAAFFPLLEYFDEAVHDFLTHCGLNSASVLSWILTWFSHDVADAETAGRLFDAFLASHPAMPVYLAVAAVSHPAHRQILFANECDPAMIHVAVGGIIRAVGGSSCDWTDDGEAPEGVVTFQDLIDDAISFMRKVPPSTLPSLARRYKEAASSNSSGPRFRRRGGGSNNGSGRDDCPIPKSSVLIKSPPSWSTAPTVTADWVLDQQRRQSLQRRGAKLPSRNKLIGATIRRKLSPTNGSLLKPPSPEEGPNYKEDNLRAKAAAGLAPAALCDDDADIVSGKENLRRSSSSLSSSSGRRPIRSTARNAAGALGNLVRGIRITSQRSRIESR